MNAITLSNVFATAVNDGGGQLIMKKALDTFRQDGQSMVQLLQSMPKNAAPHLGRNVDIRA
jgi:hypothetical protein